MILEFATIDAPPPRDQRPVYLARAEYQPDPNYPSVVTCDPAKAMPDMAPIGSACAVEAAGDLVAVRMTRIDIEVAT